MAKSNERKKTSTKIPVSKLEVESLINNKLLIVQQDRLSNAPANAVHELELHTIFKDASKQLLIPLGCVKTFRLADAELALALQFSYRVPAEWLEVNQTRAATLSFPDEEQNLLQPNEYLDRFIKYRKALLYALVWGYKQIPLEISDYHEPLEELLNSLDAEQLSTSSLMMDLIKELETANQPPRERVASGKIEDTTAEVERWYWFGLFLKDKLFGGEKMNEQTRAWFLQFKNIPWEIRQPRMPAVLYRERVPVLSWLLFLRIFSVENVNEEWQIFKEEFLPVFKDLPSNELYRIFFQALLFKGFFMDQANGYFIAPSAKDLFIYSEYQALLLSDMIGLPPNAKMLKKLRKGALTALQLGIGANNLADHVYAYYKSLNPSIANRGVVWLHELEGQKKLPATKTKSERKKKKKSDTNVSSVETRPSFSPKEEELVLMMHVAEAVPFFEKHFSVVKFEELSERYILFLDERIKVEPETFAENILSLSSNRTLSGNIRISVPSARICSTTDALGRIRELQLFHLDALATVRSLFPVGCVLLIALEDYNLTKVQLFWIWHLIQDSDNFQKVIVINLLTGKKAVKGQSRSNNKNMQSSTNYQPVENDQTLEIDLSAKLQTYLPSSMKLFNLDLQKENFELIRWLRPVLKDVSWKQTVLWYLGSSDKVPEKLTDAILRAHPDIIVYDEQMRYMFYNL